MPKECKLQDKYLKIHDEFVAYHKYISNQKENHCQNEK